MLAVHPEDFDCVVEPGITWKQLNEHLRDQGLFFPIDPGGDASLGGMASTRASGTTAVRYGTMKDNVLALKVVLPNGQLMSTSRRARKSSAGYDLTRLMVGAEGTLGVITELTLKLHGIPEAVSAGMCPFPSIKAACDAAIATIQAGIPVARVEFLDEVQVRACNADAKLGLPETADAVPRIPWDGRRGGGTVGAVRRARAGVLAVVPSSGQQNRRTGLAFGRRAITYIWADKSYRPGAAAIATDVCVPISRLAECVTETKDDIERSGLVAPIVGHVGDGNFHCVALVMMDDAEEVERATAFIDRLVERALAMEGTCTGEHGVGQGKKRFLERRARQCCRGSHARNQARLRSRRNHEPRQDRLGRTLPARAANAVRISDLQEHPGATRGAQAQAPGRCTHRDHH